MSNDPWGVGKFKESQAIDTDRMRWEREYMGRFEGRSRGPKPQDVLDIAHNNPVVKACVDGWRAGQFTWEQCLIQAVMYLVESNKRYEETAVKAMQNMPPTVIKLTEAESAQLRKAIGRRDE